MLFRSPRSFHTPSLPPPSRRVAPLGAGRPRFGHSPAAGASGRGLRRGLAIPRPAVIPTHFVVGIHGWAPGGTRSLALARLRLGRCPRREDRRGSSRRSAALFRPAGFGWGRARLIFFLIYVRRNCSPAKGNEQCIANSADAFCRLWFVLNKFNEKRIFHGLTCLPVRSELATVPEEDAT